jgi:hypothetical protein
MNANLVRWLSRQQVSWNQILNETISSRYSIKVRHGYQKSLKKVWRLKGLAPDIE